MRGAWVLLFVPGVLWAQASATLNGRVFDPDGAAVAGARVALENPVAGFERQTLTGGDGAFVFSNVPFQTCVLRVEMPGFAPHRRTVALRSNIPVSLEVPLALAAQAESVQVSAFEEAPLVDTRATGTRAELNARAIEHMPLATGTRGLESVLLSFPGFAADANGAIHPRGAHNQMQYVIDGMPVTDQLTGAFGTAIDASVVETIELFTGNIPAEFGGKVSGVAVITTRSGIGSGRRFSGSVDTSAGEFDTLSERVQAAGGTDRFGYFGSFHAVKSNRFLDQVSLDNLHNGGNAERAFARVDWHAGARDALRFNAMSGRSSFQLANLRSQHAAGQDQRQLLRDYSAGIGWLRTPNAHSTLDATASWRTAVAQLFPSAGDTPVQAAQARHLTTVALAGRYNRIAGRHTVRTGLDYQTFPVSENFSFAFTAPVPGPRVDFSSRGTGTLASGFFQDEIRAGRLVLSLGVRYDRYRFLARGGQVQPRTGAAFHLRETGTVLRVSYNRLFQTPVNENLLLSSAGLAAGLGPVQARVIRPERQNVYEAGVQQAIGARASVSAVWYHKQIYDLHDNDNFLNTGIIFPTALERARVNGFEVRAVLPAARGFTSSIGATHYRAVATPPFTGGLFVGSNTALLGGGAFVLDHDQKLGLQANTVYRWAKGVWMSAALRYDSGLVTNPSNPAVVAADPDYADLLPYVKLHDSPPRVTPRALLDVAVGYERKVEGRRRWDVQLQATNLTGKTALYNFQSIFVGTRLVAPRMFNARMRWFW